MKTIAFLSLLASTAACAIGQDFSITSSRSGVALPLELTPRLQNELLQVMPGHIEYLPNIDGRMIACEAAKCYPPAQALRARGKTIVQLFSDAEECDRSAARILGHFLNLQAKNQEDEAASQALRAYYSRIAILEQMILAAKSDASIDRNLEQLQSIRASGLASDVDVSEFEREKLRLREQTLELETQDLKLRNALLRLSGVDFTIDGSRLESLDIAASPLNPEILVETGLRLRRDLQAWEFLSPRISDENAHVFAQMLGSIAGSWGVPLPNIKGLAAILCGPNYEGLASSLRAELQVLISYQRELIRQQIEDAVIELELAYRKIEFAEQMLESWRTRLAQLDVLESKGEGRPEERGIAESSLLQSEAAHIQRRLEARLAEVKLATALGGLADRCCRGEAWLLIGQATAY